MPPFIVSFLIIIVLLLGAVLASVEVLQWMIILVCCLVFVMFVALLVRGAPAPRQPARDPVHCDEETGLWYFWEETWAQRQGPFGSEAEARFALKSYVKNVLEAL